MKRRPYSTYESAVDSFDHREIDAAECNSESQTHDQYATTRAQRRHGATPGVHGTTNVVVMSVHARLPSCTGPSGSSVDVLRRGIASKLLITHGAHAGGRPIPCGTQRRAGSALNQLRTYTRGENNEVESQIPGRDGSPIKQRVSDAPGAAGDRVALTGRGPMARRTPSTMKPAKGCRLTQSARYRHADWRQRRRRFGEAASPRLLLTRLTRRDAQCAATSGSTLSLSSAVNGSRRTPGAGTGCSTRRRRRLFSELTDVAAVAPDCKSINSSTLAGATQAQLHGSRASAAASHRQEITRGKGR